MLFVSSAFWDWGPKNFKNKYTYVSVIKVISKHLAVDYWLILLVLKMISRNRKSYPNFMLVRYICNSIAFRYNFSWCFSANFTWSHENVESFLITLPFLKEEVFFLLFCFFVYSFHKFSFFYFVSCIFFSYLFNCWTLRYLA